MSKPLLYAALILSLCFAACRSKNQYASKPSRGSSSTEAPPLNVSTVIYHGDDSISTAYLRVSNENLLYKRPDTSQAFYACIQVFYELLPSGNARKIADSGSFMMFDRGGAEKVDLKFIFSKLFLRALPGNNYTLELELYDMNRRAKNKVSVGVFKESKFSGQNFIVFRRDSVVFADNLHKGKQVEIRYSDFNASSLDVDVFRRDFGLALPPFSTKEPDPLKYKPDSTFILPGSAGIFEMQMPNTGFYHLRPPGSAELGLTLHTFPEAFPGVGDSREMIECTRYIMSREEYDKLMSASDKKAAIDQFWLTIGGSNEHARELIKKYYSRVKEANERFTSYTQGWKTDRGMIHIVFGPPVNQYHSRKDEIWVYGNEANPATLRFVFNKTRNPYSENDFVMERSQFYKEPWHSAVDYWRQGHVYLDQRR